MSNLTWCGFTTKHDKRWFRAVLAYFGAHPSLYKINDLVTTWWRGVIASGHEAPVWVNDVLFYWLVNCQNTRILNAMKHHKIALGRARDTPKKEKKMRPWMRKVNNKKNHLDRAAAKKQTQMKLTPSVVPRWEHSHESVPFWHQMSCFSYSFMLHVSRARGRQIPAAGFHKICCV